MQKRKIYGMIIGIVSFILLMLGVAYAYFYWSSNNDDKTNVNLTVTKGLANVIVYNQGVSILSTDGAKLEAADSYTGGISATIEFWKKPTAEFSIYGQISLEILQMLSKTGTTDANIGKTDTIKWAITTYTIEDATEVLLQEGTFNGKNQGDKFPLTQDFELNSIQTFYKIYIWLDSSAVDGALSVVGELLSVEISASASDTMSHYLSPLQVLTNLGLAGDVKSGTPDFSVISPYATSYAQSVSTGSEVNINSNITGNRTLGTGITFDSATGDYTLTGTSTYQSYNNDAVGKYTCNGTATTCSKVYKINTVNVNSETTNYSETDWVTYGSTLSSSSNRTVSTEYTFDGTYYQLSGTIYSSVSYDSSHAGYYTCNNDTGTNCSVLYRIESVSGTSATVVRKQRNSNYNYVTNADVYTQTVTSYNEDDIGIFSAQDDLGTSYYFRGNVENNYVKFGKNSSGQDMYWRIVRINGDGSIRLIYDGTSAHANGESSTDRRVGTSEFNTSYNDNAYVGYMYGTAGASTYEETHANTNNSTIKEYIDDWYKTNIVDTGYSSYVTDAIYCNDRSLDTSNASYTGIGTTETHYAGKQRIETNKTPILTCTQANDKFTVSSELGNGKLTYPVGLITADELALAGGTDSTENSSYYLYTGNEYWTMTTCYFAGWARPFVVYIDGGISDIMVFDVEDVRPVISIGSSAITGGTGTMIDPFTVS